MGPEQITKEEEKKRQEATKSTDTDTKKDDLTSSVLSEEDDDEEIDIEDYNDEDEINIEDYDEEIGNEKENDEIVEQQSASGSMWLWDERPDNFEKEVTQKHKDGPASLMYYFRDTMLKFMNKKLSKHEAIETVRRMTKAGLLINYLQSPKEKVTTLNISHTNNDDVSSVLMPLLLPFDLSKIQSVGWNVFKCFWIWYDHFINSLSDLTLTEGSTKLDEYEHPLSGYFAQKLDEEAKNEVKMEYKKIIQAETQAEGQEKEQENIGGFFNEFMGGEPEYEEDEDDEDELMGGELEDKDDEDDEDELMRGEPDYEEDEETPKNKKKETLKDKIYKLREKFKNKSKEKIGNESEEKSEDDELEINESGIESYTVSHALRMFITQKLDGQEGLEKSLLQASRHIENAKDAFRIHDDTTGEDANDVVRLVQSGAVKLDGNGHIIEDESNTSKLAEFNSRVGYTKRNIELFNFLSDYEMKLQNAGFQTDDLLKETDNDKSDRQKTGHETDSKIKDLKNSVNALKKKLTDAQNELTKSKDNAKQDKQEELKKTIEDTKEKLKKATKELAKAQEKSTVVFGNYKSVPAISEMVKDINEAKENDRESVADTRSLKYLLSIDKDSDIFNRYEWIDKKNMFLLMYIDLINNYLAFYNDGVGEKTNDIINDLLDELSLASKLQKECEIYLNHKDNINLETDLNLNFDPNSEEAEALKAFINEVGIDREKLKKFQKDRHPTLETYFPKGNEKNKEKVSIGKDSKLLTDKKNIEKLLKALKALEPSALKKAFSFTDSNINNPAYSELLKLATITYNYRGKLLEQDSLQTDENKFLYLLFIRTYCRHFLIQYKNDLVSEMTPANTENQSQDDGEDAETESKDKRSKKRLSKKKAFDYHKLQLIAINLLLAKCSIEYERARQAILDREKIAKRKRIQFQDGHSEEVKKGGDSTQNQEKQKPDNTEEPETPNNPSTTTEQPTDEEPGELESNHKSNSESKDNERTAEEADSPIISNHKPIEKELISSEQKTEGNDTLDPLQSDRLATLRTLRNQDQNHWRYIRAKYRIMIMYLESTKSNSYVRETLGIINRKITEGDNWFIKGVNMSDLGSYSSIAASLKLKAFSSTLEEIQREDSIKSHLGNVYTDDTKNRESIIKAASGNEDIINNDDWNMAAQEETVLLIACKQVQNDWRYLRAKYRVMIKRVIENNPLSSQRNFIREKFKARISQGDKWFLETLQSSPNAPAFAKVSLNTLDALESNLEDLQNSYNEYLGEGYLDDIKDRESVIRANSGKDDIIYDDKWNI